MAPRSLPVCRSRTPPQEVLQLQSKFRCRSNAISASMTIVRGSSSAKTMNSFGQATTCASSPIPTATITAFCRRGSSIGCWGPSPIGIERAGASLCANNMTRRFKCAAPTRRSLPLIYKLVRKYSVELGFKIGAHALRATAVTITLDHQADIPKVRSGSAAAISPLSATTTTARFARRQPALQSRT